MIRLKTCITIAAPPEAVWTSIEDIETHTEWMQDAVAIVIEGEQRHGTGTRFTCLTRVGPFSLRDRFTVTEWRPGFRMGIEHTGAVRGTGVFRLAARLGGRTRFCWIERLRFPWWLGGVVGEVVAWPILRHVWRANLRRLRARVELRS